LLPNREFHEICGQTKKKMGNLMTVVFSDFQVENHNFHNFPAVEVMNFIEPSGVGNMNLMKSHDICFQNCGCHETMNVMKFVNEKLCGFDDEISNPQ
jgi:hypothetical protein